MVQADPRLFFQVAAGLIPALIFGGLISDRLKPSPSMRPWHPLVMLLLAIPALAILEAEVLSINAALTGEPDAFTTWLVALVLVGLTALALVILIAPWYRPFAAGPVGRRQRIAMTAILAVFSIGLAVQSASLLVSAVDLEQTSQRAEQSSQQLAATLSKANNRDTTSQFLAAYDRAYQARAAAGLVSKREARKVHVCLTDRAFLAAFQAAVDSLRPNAKPFPVDAEKFLLPGRPIHCHGLATP